jgi:hypothetical protein
MKVTGVLFFLAGLAAAFSQEVKELHGINKSIVCIKKEMVI